MSRARVRWLVAVAAMVAACAAGLIDLATASGRAERRASSSPVSGALRAQPLRGDRLLAGPVLLGHQVAIWAEAGPHRLLVRSLDVFGRTRTIFSTRQAKGVPENTPWPFAVSTLVAGAGRVAFVEQVAPCISAPPPDQNVHCRPPETRGAWNSATLFAGRAGAIKAVEQTDHLCARGQEPLDVGIAGDLGLVVYEVRDVCGRQEFRLSLHRFDGRLERMLIPPVPPPEFIPAPLAAGGRWAAIVQERRHGVTLRMMRVDTGATQLRVKRAFIDDVAVDRSGRFAFLSPSRASCESSVFLGQTAGPHLVAASAESDSNIPTSNTVDIAGPQVAFLRPVARCAEESRIVLASAGARTRALTGPADWTSLAFDGRLLAAIRGQTIRLSATDCPEPAVAVPDNEPVYTTGATGLISGLYIQGGAVPQPPCRPEPRGPYAGRVTVYDSGTGAVVRSQMVRRGRLAHIPLAPGSYRIQGKLSDGVSTFPARVMVRSGQTVRQDTFQDVP